MPARRQTGKPAGKAVSGKTTKKPATNRAPRRKKLPDGMSMNDMTRERAYELWMEHRTDGRDQDDWMRAEAEVRATYKSP